jgi:hypothetical protein
MGCNATQLDRIGGRFGGTYRLHLQGRRGTEVYSKQISIAACLKVICFSETSAYFHRTTRLYSPEDRVLKALLQLVVQFTALSASGLLGINPYDDGRDLNWKGLGRRKLQWCNRGAFPDFPGVTEEKKDEVDSSDYCLFSIFSTLKVKATSSETSMNYRAVRHHIPTKARQFRCQ